MLPNLKNLQFQEEKTRDTEIKRAKYLIHITKRNKRHTGKILYEAHVWQDMEFEAYKLIHSVCAAEEGQEERDQEKKTGKKKKKTK